MTKAARPTLVVSNTAGITVRGLCVFYHNQQIYLYFRTKKDPKDVFHVALSDDGFTFTKIDKDFKIQTGVYTTADLTMCSNFSISKHGKDFVLTYLWQNGKRTLLEKSWSQNLLDWTYEGNMLGIEHAGIIVSDYFTKKRYLLLAKEDGITTYLSKDLISWEKQTTSIKNTKVEQLDCAVPTDKGILCIYHTKENKKYTGEVMLLDRNDPSKVLWHASKPLWEHLDEWQDKEVTPLGIVLADKMLIGYWQVTGEGIFAYVYGLHQDSDGHMSKDVSLQLTRTRHNPLIAPREYNSWEAFTTFNPAAVFDEGKVHLLYRAQGYDYVSVLGYAASSNGLQIDERLNMPAYAPTQDFEFVGNKDETQIAYQFVSGGGYGGCEDPRLTRIDDKYYLTYVAFDGYNPPRVALTSIKREHFLAKKWLWEKPVIISPPGVVDKSAVIFPEKINGKYVIMHRIYPNILLDYVDSLEFNGTTWLKGQYKITPRADKWDSRKIGAGAPPIKTQYGWLLIYQSVGEQDPGRYKIGAMLLDLADPTEVIYRSQSPILEPDEVYENEGFKAGVIYPCGAVVVHDTLYVYYGGADSYVCVATANLEKFLQELMHSEIAKLTTPIIEKVL